MTTEADTLAATGRRLWGIANPPARTFEVPAEVRAPIELMLRLANDARALGAGLRIDLVGEGALTLAIA